MLVNLLCLRYWIAVLDISSVVTNNYKCLLIANNYLHDSWITFYNVAIHLACFLVFQFTKVEVPNQKKHCRTNGSDLRKNPNVSRCQKENSVMLMSKNVCARPCSCQEHLRLLVLKSAKLSLAKNSVGRCGK